MKRDQQCPKCRSRNVGYALQPKGYSSTLMLGDTQVATERWVCTDCGFVEIYAIDLEQDWPAVLDVYYGAPPAGPFR